jgi:diguanylate cyclase (GGDEF)-like protein
MRQVTNMQIKKVDIGVNESIVMERIKKLIASSTDNHAISELEEINKLIEEHFTNCRTSLRQMTNILFKIKRMNDEIVFTMLEGKLVNQLGLQLGVNKMDFDQEIIADLCNKLELAFKGYDQSFHHELKGVHLYTMLSPIYEEDTIVEVIGSSIDVTAFEFTEKHVEHIVTHDTLTHLPNRHKLMKDMEGYIHNKYEKRPYAVLLCDLDRLKAINDSLGQLSGDTVIQIITERITSLLDDDMILYRLGGDEFILILKEERDLHTFAEEILFHIRQPIILANHDFSITATIGVSYFDEPANKAEEYINRASIALHYGKVNGGDKILEYNSELRETYDELLLLESDIRKAFKLNEFKLAYQPKVDVETNEIIGVEALIRWEHGKKGKISPATFIPIAEEIGLIHQIGEWVLQEACMQFVRWREQGAEPVIIAVNVSALEIQQQGFLEKVERIVEETGMDPNYLEIEITENSVMQNTKDCIETMRALRRMGISLSIDDFGTGYSSMGYLQKFPINYLKIDQSFLKDLFIEAGSAEIIKAMIQLGHTFGLKVVAEGVEGENMLQFIREEACDYYQGYLYSKPVAAEEIRGKLTKVH